jgi:hypothetical protein
MCLILKLLVRMREPSLFNWDACFFVHNANIYVDW